MFVKCPDCGKPLTVKKERNKYHFRCIFCGFNRQISAQSEEQAYLLLSNKIQETNLMHKLSNNGKREKSRDSTIRKTKNEKAMMIKEGGYSYNELPNVLKTIINNPDIELIYYKFFPKRLPKFADKNDIIPNELKILLEKKGINNLFEFQLESLKKIMHGKNVVIVAPTGTGKTEAFLFPILISIYKQDPNPIMRRGPFAIFIYPTKALAKDQKKKIDSYGKELGIVCEIFDGDTPPKIKEQIFDNPPDILITNPDMIHIHLRRMNFRSLIKFVRFIVIDELHVSIGAFGSNIYYILKRLNRISSNPIQFIGASATIGNAKFFAEQLFDSNVDIVEVKNARRSPTHLIITYPYGVSSYTITGEITKRLCSYNHKTLVFQNSHKNTEIVNLLLRSMRINSSVHRAGLNKKLREKIEESFRKGELEVLVSTPTLELGIDIGNVDAVVSALVDITSFIQRIGRAGRRGQEAIAALVLREDDPISTYYLQYPHHYFSDISQGYIEPNNEVVSYHQLLSAAIEQPIHKNEFKEQEAILTKLVQDGLLIKDKDYYRISKMDEVYKILKKYNIRGIGDSVNIIDSNGRHIGDRTMPMAARELHPGAIYLLGGNYYRSLFFNYNNKFNVGRVEVKKIKPIKRKTTAQRFAFPEILSVISKKKVMGTEALYCDLRITETVLGYTESNIFTNDELKDVELNEPIVYSFVTKGFVFTMPPPILLFNHFNNLSEDEFLAGTFHAVEHVLIETSGMITGGGSSELGGIAMGRSGMIFVYDGAKGGSGLAKLLFDKLEEGLMRALKTLESCSCTTVDGCPRCTYSYQCGNNNKPLNKIGAIESLKLLKTSNLTVNDNYKEFSPIV